MDSMVIGRSPRGLPSSLVPINGTEEHLPDILELLGVGHFQTRNGLRAGLGDPSSQAKAAARVVHDTRSHGI